MLLRGHHPGQAILGGHIGFGALLDCLASALHDDIGRLTGGQHQELLAATALTFLSIKSFAGFCTNRDDDGQPLDGYLIGLHDGLYSRLKLRAKAFVADSLEGDLAVHKGNSRTSYEVATEFFLLPRSELLDHIDLADVPPELAGILASVQSDAAIIVMQFVALHEFGHVAANDFALMDRYKFHLGDNNGNPARPPATQDFWDTEFRADESVLRWLASADRTPESHWTNFAMVHGFFVWLADIETRLGGPLCPLHPPPVTRGRRLLSTMAALVPPNEHAHRAISWVERAIASWRDPTRRPAA